MVFHGLVILVVIFENLYILSETHKETHEYENNKEYEVTEVGII